MTESLFWSCACSLADEYLCILWNFKASHFSDSYRTLTNDLSIKSTVDKHCLSYLVSLFIIKEVATSLDEFLLNIVVNCLISDNCLLCSTDHTVIKCLRMNDRVYSVYDISRRIDDS